jgi:hypothetical protein
MSFAADPRPARRGPTRRSNAMVGSQALEVVGIVASLLFIGAIALGLF